MPNADSAVASRSLLADVVVLCAQEELREVLTYWLRTLPVTVFIADDGYHASRILENAEAALLVTDRIIPPWPGLGTFLQLRSRHPQLRIAFLENGTTADRILARVTGAGFVLPHPLTRQSIMDVVSSTKSSHERTDLRSC